MLINRIVRPYKSIFIYEDYEDKTKIVLEFNELQIHKIRRGDNVGKYTLRNGKILIKIKVNGFPKNLGKFGEDFIDIMLKYDIDLKMFPNVKLIKDDQKNGAQLSYWGNDTKPLTKEEVSEKLENESSIFKYK